MNGYQADISTFTGSDSVVFGISTDPLATNQKFAESLNLEFALLSDEDGAVAKMYDILNAERKMAGRATFVVSKDGKITHVETGSAAVDPAGADSACSKL